MTVLLVVLGLVLQGLDIYSTNAVISRGDIEKNKIMQWAMDKFGKYWFIPKLLLTVPSIVLLGVYAVPVLVLVDVIYLVVVTNNFLALKGMGG